MIVGGIFGPKKSGKTTLAKKLGMEYWQREGRRCFVNDPNMTDDWGPCFWQPQMIVKGAYVPEEQRDAEFWYVVQSTKNGLVICDDAGKTINRDKDLNDIFTRINHNGHKLLVVGHGGVNLTPIMRQQMDTLYLFRTTPKEAEKWVEVFGDPTLKDAYTLQQYEFFYARQYKPTERLKLNL